jgi:hypothetical protein
VQPIGPVQHVFEWFSVYGAVEPATGDRFFLELPYLNAEMFQLFSHLLWAFEATTLQSLKGNPDLAEAMHALCA